MKLLSTRVLLLGAAATLVDDCTHNHSQEETNTTSNEGELIMDSTVPVSLNFTNDVITAVWHITSLGTSNGSASLGVGAPAVSLQIALEWLVVTLLVTDWNVFLGAQHLVNVRGGLLTGVSA